MLEEIGNKLCVSYKISWEEFPLGFRSSGDDWVVRDRRGLMSLLESNFGYNSSIKIQENAPNIEYPIQVKIKSSLNGDFLEIREILAIVALRGSSPSFIYSSQTLGVAFFVDRSNEKC